MNDSQYIKQNCDDTNYDIKFLKKIKTDPFDEVESLSDIEVDVGEDSKFTFPEDDPEYVYEITEENEDKMGEGKNFQVTIQQKKKTIRRGKCGPNTVRTKRNIRTKLCNKKPSNVLITKTEPSVNRDIFKTEEGRFRSIKQELIDTVKQEKKPEEWSQKTFNEQGVITRARAKRIMQPGIPNTNSTAKTKKEPESPKGNVKGPRIDTYVLRSTTSRIRHLGGVVSGYRRQASAFQRGHSPDCSGEQKPLPGVRNVVGDRRRCKYFLRNEVTRPRRYASNACHPMWLRRCIRRHLEDCPRSEEEERLRGKGKGRKVNRVTKNKVPFKLRAGNIADLLTDNIGINDRDEPGSIDPVTLDTDLGFHDVCGLEDHIRSLKEMVLFPMLYGDIFEQFGVVPPKGVLFHGPPGTGKTLLARALAAECSKGERRVSFFVRNGADCLSKWVGESESGLRRLFERAHQLRPSIIFFDEIDGLAPKRSSRQDQIHERLVTTLLTLMDGVKGRGDIIVIGATNRLDTLDPALRRPGRFDRELFFPLPSKKEREEIIRMNVSQWSNKPENDFVGVLAENTSGYCGSDLRSLCTEAVLQVMKRKYPQIYESDQKLHIDPNTVNVRQVDFLRAQHNFVPAANRAGRSPARRLSPMLKPLLQPVLEKAIGLLQDTFPFVSKRSEDSELLEKDIYRPRFLLVGETPDQGQTTHLAPALLHRMDHIPVYTIDMTSLYEKEGCTPEAACIQIFREACRNPPSTIYVPSLDLLWDMLEVTVRTIFLSTVQNLDPSSPVLLLATCDTAYNQLPVDIGGMFSDLKGEVMVIRNPSLKDRIAFFESIFLKEALIPPKTNECKKRKALSNLPVAQSPKRPMLSEEEGKRLSKREEEVLTNLKMSLKKICTKLCNNPEFFVFSEPINTTQVPDCLSVIEEQIDLGTIMKRIDSDIYICPRDFIDDIDAVVNNALRYNADKESLPKLRDSAFVLRKVAYQMIRSEFSPGFEVLCKEIARKRRTETEYSCSLQTNGLCPLLLDDSHSSAVNEPFFRYSKNVRTENASQNGCHVEVSGSAKLEDDGNIICIYDNSKRNLSGSETTTSDQSVSISKERALRIDLPKLGQLFEKTVEVTAEWTTETLIEFYLRLLKLVRKYSKYWSRMALIQELEQEILRSQDISEELEQELLRSQDISKELEEELLISKDGN